MGWFDNKCIDDLRLSSVVSNVLSDVVVVVPSVIVWIVQLHRGTFVRGDQTRFVKPQEKKHATWAIFYAMEF